METIVICLFMDGDGKADVKCPHVAENELDAQDYVIDQIKSTIDNYPVDGEAEFLKNGNLATDDDFNEAYIMLKDSTYFQWNIKRAI